jgi:hypothetical protein
VIDQAGPIPRRTGLAQDESDARRAGIDYPMHAFRATIEAFGSAAAHRGLIGAAIQPPDDYVGNLFNQLFQIAVVRI